MSESTRTRADTAKTRRMHDARTYWRIALAVIAPMPWLAMGLTNILLPFAGDASFAETVRLVRQHLDVVLGTSWLSLLFFTFLIPSAVAVVAATRRRTPWLAVWGGSLTVVGFGAGLGGLGGGGTPMAIITVTHGFDVATMARLDEAFLTLPQVPVAGLVWIAALIIGQALLGIALWRSRLVPMIFPIALLLGGPTHPFVPGGQLPIGIGLVVAAVGYAGVSLALLRTTNDEFDLPPVIATDRAIPASPAAGVEARDTLSGGVVRPHDARDSEAAVGADGPVR
jgi:hypothetical protein